MVESDKPKSKTIPSFKELADSPIHTILTKENRQKVLTIEHREYRHPAIYTALNLVQDWISFNLDIVF